MPDGLFTVETRTTDYLDGFQYVEGQLQFFPTSEGYVKDTFFDDEHHFNYVYQYKDHLGNVRLTYGWDPHDDELVIMVEDNYYPYGLKHRNYNMTENEYERIFPGGIGIEEVDNGVYNYKYNGKEWQDELGLNMYDMDLRDYDPAIGRWVCIDPVVHYSQSTYNGFDGNPVYWADPSGGDVIETGDRFIFTGTDAGNMFSAMADAYDGGEGEFKMEGEYHDLSTIFSEDGQGNGGGTGIIFLDRDGDLVATYATSKVEMTVSVTIPLSLPSVNLNINTMITSIGGMDDVDVVGVGGNFDVTFVMGGGTSWEAVFFLDGKDVGEHDFYRVTRGNVGVAGAGGFYAIAGDFHDDKVLSKSDYLGRSYSIGIDIGMSATLFWAPKNNYTDPTGVKSLIWSSNRSWTGYNIGLGAGGGIQYSWQWTKIWN